MSIFESLSDMSKLHYGDSGCYNFELKPITRQEVIHPTFEPTEPEPAPTVSLYNLLDHAPKDLIVAMVAFKNEAERIYDQRESSSNMADAYTSLCAWAKIFDTAINEKRDRDSEAWAEKTAKEINETL